jgi:hypothetical protein
MNANSKQQMVAREGSQPGSAEQRLKELDIRLPAPPEPDGNGWLLQEVKKRASGR